MYVLPEKCQIWHVSVVSRQSIKFDKLSSMLHSQYSTVFVIKICASCRKLRRFRIRNLFGETLPFAKADNKDVETAAVKIIFLFSAFANGSVSQNWLHIENRRNFLQLTHILVLKTVEYCVEFGLVLNECGREYDVLRLAGAEVHVKIAVESRGPLPGANTINSFHQTTCTERPSKSTEQQ